MAEAGCHDETCEKSGRGVEYAAPDEKCQETEPETGECRRETGGGLSDPEDDIGAGRKPIVEDRLFEPIDVVEVRCEPVSALDHLAGTLGIEPLIGIGDRRAAKTGKKREGADSNQDKHSARHGRAILCHGLYFDHGDRCGRRRVA